MPETAHSPNSQLNGVATPGTAGCEPCTQTTIEITKDYLHFSAAHFTLFSASERENLHGHNFDVSCYVDTEIGDDGLAFDYNAIKSRLEALCNELDERTILPAQSPHLNFETMSAAPDDYLIVCFGAERIPFLQRDVLLLPIRNATVEEFARYFISRLTSDSSFTALPISALQIKISSGPGQWASCQWRRT